MNFAKLTAYIDSLEERYGIPAADCKITREHEVVYRHMTGHSDDEKKVPVTDRDLYRLFSATKLITNVAVLQLMERKQLDLYDLLRSYLPEFTNMRVADHFTFDISTYPFVWPGEDTLYHLANNEIRIIDLMTMTAGMSYDLSAAPLKRLKEESRNQATTREVVAAMAKIPLLYEPRTKWSYSMAHDVLAAVIEEVSGMRFSEYLHRNIFQPLGNDDVYFRLDEKNEKRLSTLYQIDPVTGEVKPAEVLPGIQITEQYESGGGGLIATVDAYSSVLEALSNLGIGANGGRILQEETVRLMSTNYLTGEMLRDYQMSAEKRRKGYGYGLGVRVHIDPEASKSRTPIGEFGWDGAAGAYALVDPINRISICYVQHLGFEEVYDKIHPTITDLAYEAMGF